jgi:hypothetical protein
MTLSSPEDIDTRFTADFLEAQFLHQLRALLESIGIKDVCLVETTAQTREASYRWYPPLRKAVVSESHSMSSAATSAKMTDNLIVGAKFSNQVVD